MLSLEHYCTKIVHWKFHFYLNSFKYYSLNFNISLKIAKEIQVALVTLIGITALYFGFGYLKGQNIFSNTNTFYTIYEKIEGLKISNSVTINGLKVGQIEDIQLLEQKNNKIIVTLEIKGTIKLASGTKALLTDGGLFGDKIIELVTSSYGESYQDIEDTLIGIKEKGLTDIVQERAIPLLIHLDSTIIQINQIAKFIAGQEEKVQKIAGNLANLTDQLQGIAQSANKNLASVLTQTNIITQNLNKSSHNFPKITENLIQFSDSLKAIPIIEISNHLKYSTQNLSEIIANINTNKSTLGLLTRDDSLYRNLNNVFRDLDILLTDIKKNPKKYVHFSAFGKKDKKEEFEKK